MTSRHQCRFLWCCCVSSPLSSSSWERTRTTRVPTQWRSTTTGAMHRKEEALEVQKAAVDEEEGTPCLTPSGTACWVHRLSWTSATRSRGMAPLPKAPTTWLCRTEGYRGSSTEWEGLTVDTMPRWVLYFTAPTSCEAPFKEATSSSVGWECLTTLNCTVCANG